LWIINGIQTWWIGRKQAKKMHHPIFGTEQGD